MYRPLKVSPDLMMGLVDGITFKTDELKEEINEWLFKSAVDFYDVYDHLDDVCLEWNNTQKSFCINISGLLKMGVDVPGEHFVIEQHSYLPVRVQTMCPLSIA